MPLTALSSDSGGLFVMEVPNQADESLGSSARAIGVRPDGLGGALGNGRLTSLVGLFLLVLLAVEGATIPFIRPLLSVHIFVGMLLLAPVALKLGATGYRFARYYMGGAEYVREGPPALLMRVFVAPILVLSTITLFGTGVLLIAAPHTGALKGLHKASFIVWFGAMTIHVLVYVLRAARRAQAELTDTSLGGKGLRLIAVVLALAIGTGVAFGTYPLARPLFHHHHFNASFGGSRK